MMLQNSTTWMDVHGSLSRRIETPWRANGCDLVGTTTFAPWQGKGVKLGAAEAGKEDMPASHGGVMYKRGSSKRFRACKIQGLVDQVVIRRRSGWRACWKPSACLDKPGRRSHSRSLTTSAERTYTLNL